MRPQDPREAESMGGANGKPACRSQWGDAWASGLETMGLAILSREDQRRSEKIKEEPFMSRTHEQSSSQKDHRGESSQEGAQRRVAPLDVVRQQAQRPQEASQQESQEAPQREAPPSLLELTFSKILEELRPEHVQKDTVGESVVSGILLKKGLAGRIFETKEWKDWLDKHGVEFFNTPVGSAWLEEHGTSILAGEWETWLDRHGREFSKTPVGSEWFEKHRSEWITDQYSRYATFLMGLPCR
jgi:hypothetical protein